MEEEGGLSSEEGGLSSEEEASSSKSDSSEASANEEAILTPPLIRSCTHMSRKFEEKLRKLEKEHEMLNSSLCALTTHFAQVQFRLRQAVAAPQADKESLLKSLEEFAFRGIPDVGVVREKIDEAKLTEIAWIRRVQQQRLVEKLKAHLKELEEIAGDEKINCTVPDQDLEMRKRIFNGLGTAFPGEDQCCYPLKTASVKEKTTTIENLETPLIIKDELATELKCQLADLECFVSYLQEIHRASHRCCGLGSVDKPLDVQTMGLVQRTVAILRMFTGLYLGGNPRELGKQKFYHWGDLRANLEVSIAKVFDAIKATTKKSDHQGLNTEKEPFCFVDDNVNVTTVVRKHLAISIRDLMVHGTTKEAPIQKILPFIGCLKETLNICDAPMHAWEVILKYYSFNKGEKINSTPVRKLSQSFDLHIVGSCDSSSQNMMLAEIGNIISMHSAYKSSYDSHLKAFICAALNANKLVAWLWLIFQCHTLVDACYRPWSYATRTRFSDSLRSLDVLTKFKFNLPVDLAVRRFRTADDAFV